MRGGGVSRDGVGGCSSRIAANVFVRHEGKNGGNAGFAPALSRQDSGPRLERKFLDEVLLAVMRNCSYTGEDIVEVYRHGGARLLSGCVLELVLARGARHAEPGEFTKRAFLNGRIDLAQVVGGS